MEYIKIKFGNDFERIGSRIERTIEEIFRPRPLNPMFASKEHCWTPPMDIYETDEQIIIRAEIAGVDKENLGVEINKKAVRIYGSRVELPRVPNATYRLAEIQYGRFERIIYLPSPVDVDIVNSIYTNGFLELRLAKQRERESYKVPISED
ncbi:MAG: Hsp20/alpha crystallin family protein [Desulfobacteraceae bacterium]|nr:Hsp20/alpha crystallin family protein [Desulfobacteraceae bacterium]